MWNNPHRLEIAEYLALFGCIAGSVAAVASKQAAFAYVPLTLAVSLNLINRYRFDRLLRRRTTAAIARIQQQLSEDISKLSATVQALPASSSGSPSETPIPAEVKQPLTPEEGSDRASVYREIVQLKEQSATVQESVSSVIHYLNSSSLLERVDRLERSVTQLSEKIVGLANQVDAAAKVRWAQKLQSPTQEQPELPAIPNPDAPEPAAGAVSAKSVVLPKFASELASQNWHCRTTIKAHADWASALAISPDGQRLVSGSFDKSVKIWHLQTGELLHTLKGHARGVFSVAVSPDSKIIASGSWDETVRLWHLEEGTLQDTLTAHSGSVRSVAISPDGKRLASGSFDETIKLWELETGVLQASWTEYLGPVYAIAFAPDGQSIASGGGDGLVQIWQVASGERINQLTGNLDFVWSLAFSPDGDLLASGNGDGTVKLWHVKSSSLIGTLSEHAGPVYSVAFSPDGQTLLSAGADGSINIWALANGKRLLSLRENSHPAISLALSPSGQLFACGSADGTIGIWERE